MLNQCPFEIQVEILKRLPVKLLIQFRSVSKAWRSLIDSSEFLAANSRHTQLQQLVLRYRNPSESEYAYVSFVDDETFPQQKISLTAPTSIASVTWSIAGSSSHGLLCLYDTFQRLVALWNPSIRKCIHISLPCVCRWYITVLGFGVCLDTLEPKIVMINNMKCLVDIEPYWDIRVYTLNSGKWKTLPSILPRDLSISPCPPVVIDKFIYWIASIRPRCLILSFDISDEVFNVVDLPATIFDLELSISKLRDCLVVFQYDDSWLNTCVVWIMEDSDGVQKAFTKLFTIETPHASISAIGFRKNGEVLMDMTDLYLPMDNEDCQSAVVCYEPDSKHINDLAICPSFLWTSMESYAESLLLLGHPGCISY